MFAHLMANSGELHDWTVAPGFFNSGMPADHFRTALQWRSLRPCTDLVWASLQLTPRARNHFAHCRNPLCLNRKLTHPARIDAYGRHPDSCVYRGGYARRHETVQLEIQKAAAKTYGKVHIEVRPAPSSSDKRTDIVIPRYPTATLLKHVEGTAQFPSIVRMLRAQRVLKPPPATDPSAPPSRTDILTGTVELHLDLTFIATGGVTATARVDRLLTGDCDALMDGRTHQKIRKYSDLLASAPSVDGAARAILPLVKTRLDPHPIT